ncbi:MAG TPA: biotin--[acetyl-CoA-carboxylase] ligase [Hanamia sp.]|jgi:BirA family biotin operon repressor/biotin-[acetyl-CoA-carboxylase] ligase|nr:biotin--[acetyl-CoA-carboxylase] ligase [Hanamia sp.]
MAFSSQNLVILDSVDSTNNYAMALIKTGKINSATAVFAKEQTDGKGRRGRDWKSKPSENIILSVAVPMQWQSVSKQFQISVATALSCYDLFQKHILRNLFIKWPNDIFINDSKAGGILIENVIKGNNWQWSVVGVGLNINQETFEEGIQSASSLKMATGKDFDVIKLAEELYSILLKRIEDLKGGQFEIMMEEYNSKLYSRGKKVRLKKQNVVFETKIVGVSSFGQLITEDSVERRFDFDEVEFKRLF